MTSLEPHNFIQKCDFAKGNGLMPVVVQDDDSKAVLMLAYTDREALEKTVDSGEMWFRSRERGLWHKGETSGNIMNLVSLHLDCDNDTILARVNPTGPACHRDTNTCFVDTPMYTYSKEKQ
jgi:phosphoribosyl-ATP pyrophosphohydrolase/phosphoribosyl-AMP cyclohydrolase